MASPPHLRKIAPLSAILHYFVSFCLPRPRQIWFSMFFVTPLSSKMPTSEIYPRVLWYFFDVVFTTLERNAHFFWRSSPLSSKMPTCFQKKTPLSSKMYFYFKNVRFKQDLQSRFESVVLNGVLVPPRLAQNTWWCPWIYFVLQATHEASRGPF